MSMMHANQIPTSQDLVRALLQRQYPALTDEPIAVSPHHGTDCDTWRVGEHHGVRLPIIDWAENDQARMRPWLPWLRDRLSLPVAVPVWYGEPDCGYPYEWTIYPWMQGHTLSFGCDDGSAARDVAAFLTELRRLPIEGAPASGKSPHELDGDVRESLAQLTVDDRRDDLVALWDEMMLAPAWDGTGAVWRHGDVAPGNLIFRDGHLVAAIDWSGLGAGDPASDLQVAWNMFSPNARSVFREVMMADDETWFRARARAFAQASFQLPYYRETLPALATQAQYVFAEILAELGR